MMNLYRAVVVGAGQIGAGHSSELLSHAGAYRKHPLTTLVGIYDVSGKSAAEAAKVWEVPAFEDIHSLMSLAKPDFVSICSPDRFHLEQIQYLLKFPIKGLIVEKPVATCAQSILRAAEIKSNIPIAVNYTRRYLPIYTELKRDLLHQKVRSITIRYAKGIKHNGVHAIDLIRMLVGNILSYDILSAHVDYTSNDPSPCVFLTAERCDNVILQPLNCQDYTYFDVDIFTNQQRVTIHTDHEIMTISGVQDNQGIPPGKRLIKLTEQQTYHSNGLYYLLDALVDYLDQKENRLYLLQDSLLSESLAVQIAAHAIEKFKVDEFNHVD